MLVNHEIVTLPSASSLAVLRDQLQGRTPAPKTLAVLADPVFNCCQDPRFQESQAVGGGLEDNIAQQPATSQQNPPSSLDAVRQFAIEMGVSLDRLRLECL